MRTTRLRHVRILVLITVICIMTYFPAANEPSLFEDEWAATRLIVAGNLSCSFSGDLFLRPLHECTRLWMHEVLGLDIRAFHFVTLALRTIVALLFYGVLVLLLPNRNSLTSGAALIFAVYPAMFFYPFYEGNYQYLSYGMLLVATLFLLSYGPSKSHAWPILGAIVLALALLFYESIVGLIIWLTVVLAVRLRKTPIAMVWGAGLPALVSLGYIVGRWQSQLKYPEVFGHSTETVLTQLSPSGLAIKVVQGYWYVAVRAWLDSLYDLFDGARNFPYRTVLPLAAILAGCSGLVLIAIALTSRSKLGSLSKPIPGSGNHGETASDRFSVLFIVLGGGSAIGAGFFPVISALESGLNYNSSRINYLPSLGASVLIVLLLRWVASSFRRSDNATRLIFAGLVTSMVCLGARVQLRSQSETNRSWAIQKSFWRAVFAQIPDWEDTTQIVLTLPEANTQLIKFGASPFSIYPEAFGGAMAMLYGHESPLKLNAVYGVDYGQLQTTMEGITVPLPYSTKTIVVPFDKAVILSYLQETGALEIVRRLDLVSATGKQEARLLCQNCVRLTPRREMELRGLVR